MLDGRNSIMFLHEDRYKSQGETGFHCSVGMYRIRIPVSGKILLSCSIRYPVKFYRIIFQFLRLVNWCKDT